jgi:UDP-3-O-[3-hydroxymyristoyl] N-acetylglucosamine deacetylase
VAFALEPARAGSGVVFVTRPRGGRGPGDRELVEIPARAEFVRSTARATTLALPESTLPDGPQVTTVEHLLAALFAFRIDNVRIVLQGSEIPVMDGSAARFAGLLREAGRTLQSAARCELVLRRPLEVRQDGDRWIRAEPDEAFGISYAIDFPHPRIGRQTFEVAGLDEHFFETELAAARTFGFAHEVESLREAGLARGGSFENSLVLGDQDVLNGMDLRWPDEFVRHKVLDLLGDLMLLGAPLRAHLSVEKGGHGLHHELVKALLATPGLLERCDQTVAA